MCHDFIVRVHERALMRPQITRSKDAQWNTGNDLKIIQIYER